MNSIGQKLKLLRNAKNTLQKTVIQKLHLAGFEISDKTLYGYEKTELTCQMQTSSLNYARFMNVITFSKYFPK